MTRQRAESLFVLDVQIGNTISRLSRTGQLANTVMMFTSDNGYYLGEHRKRQGKINLHEPSLRVPLIIAGPGVPKGRRFDPVTTVDMAPTLASYAGVKMPGTDGIDLNRTIEKGDSGWDRPVVTEGMMPEGRYAQLHRLGPTPLNTRGLRLGRWKITRYSTGELELYDLETDPLELRNLSRVPEYAEVKAKLKQLYREYSDCHGKGCRAEIREELAAHPGGVEAAHRSPGAGDERVLRELTLPFESAGLVTARCHASRVAPAPRECSESRAARYASVNRGWSCRSSKRSRSSRKASGSLACLRGPLHQAVASAVDHLDGLARLVDALGIAGPGGDHERGAVAPLRPVSSWCLITGTSHFGIRSELSAHSRARVSLISGLAKRAISWCL